MILYSIICLLGKFPLRLHYRMVSLFKWILKSMMQYRRDVVLTNLARSFPEKDCREISELANRFYSHLGEIMAESIWFAGTTPERLRDSEICVITNPQVLEEAYGRGRSVMILSSHTGNWELIGGLRYYNRDPQLDYVFDESHICIVYKRQSSWMWNEILKKARTTVVENFEGLVESDQIVRYVCRHGGEQKIYFFINDQRPYRGKGRYIGNFMNQKTCGMAASVRLARKYQMSLLFSKMERKEKGHYEITYVPLAEDASGKGEGELLEMYFSELENEIRSNPENYLWSHKRWS